MKCTLCPRKCGIDRSVRVGACGMPDTIRIGHAMLHKWEEPCLSGENGSGAIFFSGCPLKCVYCQNWELSHNNYGTNVTPEELLRVMRSMVEMGAHNINLVTPTHYAAQLAEILREFRSPIPIVYNTSGYESVETLKLLDGLVDVYLTDLKYSDNETGKKYSGVPDYFDVATEAILEMQRQVGMLTLNSENLAEKGLMVRHLILPSNVGRSVEALRWISENLPYGTMVSLMSQYVPNGHTKDFPAIDRKLSRREYKIAVKAAIDLHIDNLYVQQLFSASDAYVPQFLFDLRDTQWLVDDVQHDIEEE